MKWHSFLLALITVVFLYAPAFAQNGKLEAYVDGLLMRYDENSDGMLDEAERRKISRSIRTRLVDSNGDGFVDRQEVVNSISGKALKDKAPAIDGVFDEWTNIENTVNDPAGDSEVAMDLTQVSGTANGTMLYLRLKFAEKALLQNGPVEDGTLVILVDQLKRQQRAFRLAIDLRGRTGKVHLRERAEPIFWDQISFGSLPTYQTNEYELQIDMKVLGLNTGQSVSVNFTGGDSLDDPLIVNFERKDADRPAYSIERPAGTDFRIANLNTLQNGLADSERGPAIARLMTAAKADINCFQEE